MSLEHFGKYNHPAFELSESGFVDLFKGLLRPHMLCRGLFEGSALVAWLGATPGHEFHHSPTRGMSQIYYHSVLQAEKGREALLGLHRDFLEQATSRDYELVLSSSYLPNYERFCDILVEDGWERVRPGRVLRRTVHHHSRTTRGESGPGMATPMPGRRGAPSHQTK